MTQHNASLPSILATALAGVRTRIAGACRALFGERPYQPEAYYMRGPGPKWREKHSSGHQSLH